MVRVLCVCALISLQLSGCLLQENTPTVAEYFLEAMDFLGREHWNYFLPNDTDIDQDGSLSDLEIDYKVHSYLGELFKMMDQDEDNIVTEEEMWSLNLEISGFTNKVIDIAMENFPLKPILLAADANGDTFYDEDDFYLPAKLPWKRPKGDGFTTKVRLREGGLPQYLLEDAYFTYVHVEDDKDGNVLCKSLGFEGLDQIVAPPEGMFDSEGDMRAEARIKFSCQGNESRLEDCQLVRLQDNVFIGNVSCRGDQTLGSLHLVGGKDASAGDIFFGEKGLGCAPDGRGLDDLSEVICRQLGFPGFAKTTRGSAFTRQIWPEYEVLQAGFSCTGTEANIADCKRSHEDQNCDENWMLGIVCKTDTRKRVDEALSDIVGWNRNSDTWETFGRILFVADSNADGKVTNDELAATAKTYVSGILEFLDQTQDDHISISDFTSLNFKVGPIHKILNLAFNVFADKINDDIDLYAPTIAGKNLYKFIGYFAENWDQNEDEKLTAIDAYYHRGLRGMSSSKMSWRYLILILNLKLDSNQDGKLHRQELKQFIDDMFKQFDDDESGEITVKDVSRLMRKHGFDCFQTGVFKSYLTILFSQMKSQLEKFMSYLFQQLDLDENKLITVEEFKKMDVPCDVERRRSPVLSEADDSRMRCYRMLDFIFGAFGDVRFPDLDEIYLNQYGQPIKSEGEESSVDKLANAACEMIS